MEGRVSSCMIRVAGPDDVEAVYNLYFHPDLNKFVLEEDEGLEKFREMYAEFLKSYTFFLYEEGEKVLGLLGYRNFWGKMKHVSRIGPILVYPEYSGKGIGSRLMERAFEEAEKDRATRVELWVEVENQRALKLYKKFGFREEGINRNRIRVGDRYLDSRVMAVIKDGNTEKD